MNHPIDDVIASLRSIELEPDEPMDGVWLAGWVRPLLESMRDHIQLLEKRCADLEELQRPPRRPDADLP